jgi:hypothetical protein
VFSISFRDIADPTFTVLFTLTAANMLTSPRTDNPDLKAVAPVAENLPSAKADPEIDKELPNRENDWILWLLPISTDCITVSDWTEPEYDKPVIEIELPSLEKLVNDKLLPRLAAFRTEIDPSVEPLLTESVDWKKPPPITESESDKVAGDWTTKFEPSHVADETDKLEPMLHIRFTDVDE